jgi:hypothetical protein
MVALSGEFSYQLLRLAKDFGKDISNSDEIAFIEQGQKASEGILGNNN